MEQLAEVMVNIASQSPILAFILFVWYRDRNDYQNRLNGKNELIDKYREREWQRLDRMESSNRTN